MGRTTTNKDPVEFIASRRDMARKQETTRYSERSQTISALCAINCMCLGALSLLPILEIRRHLKKSHRRIESGLMRVRLQTVKGTLAATPKRPQQTRVINDSCWPISLSMEHTHTNTGICIRRANKDVAVCRTCRNKGIDVVTTMELSSVTKDDAPRFQVTIKGKLGNESEIV
jgi:hypothetical protein